MVKVNLTEITCWCGLPFAIPTNLYNEALRSGQSFHCPLGHSNTFKTTETEKLRRERDRLKQKVAERDDTITDLYRQRDAMERSASAYKGQMTKLKKRASAGVCPCCNRTFQNLARHMKSKHPDFAESGLEVVEGGKK